MVLIFKDDDYVVRIKKPKKERQAKIPKPPADYNGSKSIPIDIPRDFKHFKRAKDLM